MVGQVGLLLVNLPATSQRVHVDFDQDGYKPFRREARRVDTKGPGYPVLRDAHVDGVYY